MSPARHVFTVFSLFSLFFLPHGAFSLLTLRQKPQGLCFLSLMVKNIGAPSGTAG